jgi:Putative beta-barrel porin-2, OmpL-like. bbp2
MNALFLLICGVSVLFFVMFLFECSRPLHKSKKPLIIRRSTDAELDSVMGGGFLARLELQMARFLSEHRRTMTSLIVMMGLLLMPRPAHAQRTQPAPPPSSDTEQQVPAAVQKQLDAMQKRIDQLEAELANRKAQEQSVAEATSHTIAEQTSGSQTPAAESALQQAGAPTQPAKPEPFSFADFTWLNGNSRVKEIPFQNAFFTPEVRADIDYIYDFAHPKDDTIGGSSEVFRSNEFQVTQFGVGGDFHWNNVMARLMTQFGMYSQTTPRNDASPARGQWMLADAYRYISEAYGGYHFNVWDGINVQAGIFMSYIGLFSYYNFDNWAYQPSYVSSNTPWFFNGMRV